MRHEARQVPSWLIFDVRQMNAIVRLCTNSRWLISAILCLPATLLVLVWIAHLPYDQESPLKNANLAIFAVVLCGLVSSLLAFVSMIQREAFGAFSLVWLAVNLGGLSSASAMISLLSRIYFG